MLDKFQMIANCYGGSNVLHMLILHSKCSINVPTSCVQPGTCRNIWDVPNLLSAGKWQVLSTRACNVLKMFSLISRPPRPQCAHIPVCGPRWTSDCRLLHEDIHVIFVPRPVEGDLILLGRRTLLERVRVRGTLDILKALQGLSGGGDTNPLC